MSLHAIFHAANKSHHQYGINFLMRAEENVSCERGGWIIAPFMAIYGHRAIGAINRALDEAINNVVSAGRLYRSTVPGVRSYIKSKIHD
jgi:hypothetical protein